LDKYLKVLVDRICKNILLSVATGERCILVIGTWCSHTFIINIPERLNQGLSDTIPKEIPVDRPGTTALQCKYLDCYIIRHINIFFVWWAYGYQLIAGSVMVPPQRRIESDQWRSTRHMALDDYGVPLHCVLVMLKGVVLHIKTLITN